MSNMRLSPAAEYAVRGAVVLAQNYGQGPTSLDAICATRELPKQYLTKIFASLTKAGLITPIRGKHGGYELAREPGQISILDVMEAVEGPLAVNFCQYAPPRCEEYQCPLRKVWTELQGVIHDKLANFTLADFI